MSWNIQVLTYKPADLPFDHIVPDVFERTDEQVIFEDAASSKMMGKLCIGSFNNTTILIDVSCKLSGLLRDFTRLTRNREMYFARVSNEEIVYSVNNRKPDTGSRFFERFLRGQSGPEFTDDMDGEQRAWKYLSFYLGFDCPPSQLDST